MCALSGPILDIAGNVARVRERIAAAAARAGRRAEDIILVAASKTVEAERIALAAQAGIADFGENYVQEAQRKIERVGRGVRWHFVGHLQTNKAKQAVALFDIVQIVDSERLAAALDKRARAAGRTLPVLVEVNTSGEATKFGAAPDEASRVAEAVASLDALELKGLMTMGRLGATPDDARPCFALLRELSQRIFAAAPGAPERWLSMGMSQDFEVAIEEGSNVVRVGTAIFGARPE
ncbi:MAG: YggS family pyridoxal phosphate-dependent enzyme [Armatimonadota bacterium]|nr:MAG: YggS family pyridoxal phosphate-dependent enzyme [Armatimonadota bacterium]